MADRSVTEMEYGAASVIIYTGKIRSHLDGAIRGEDPEHVHRLRTNSRHLRTIISVFPDLLEDPKALNSEVKNLMKDLSRARDLDVRIDKIDGWMREENPKKVMEGLRELKERFIEERRREQENVERAVKELKKKGLLDDLERRCESIAGSFKGKDHNSFSSGLYTRAVSEISKRMEKVLKRSVCIPDEGAAAKHHRFRISVKKLRYTLGLFRDIYADDMKEERKMLKVLHDATGEMHDMDLLRKEIEDGMEMSWEGKTDTSEGVTPLIEKKRSEEYRRFKKGWKTIRKEDRLHNILENARRHQLLNKDVRKLGVISDIHGNLHALKAVVKDARKRGVERFIIAGDLVGYGAFPDEVLDLISNESFVSVKGNFDRDVIENGNDKKNDLGNIAIRHSNDTLSRANLKRLARLPESVRVKIKGVDYLVVHGSPDSPDEHLWSNIPDSRFLEIARDNPEEIIIFGHTHQQVNRKIGSTHFLNPGSVGRTSEGTSYAQYAVIRTQPLSFEMINIDYNMRAAVKAIRNRGLPEEFARMIIEGKGLKDVLREDRKRKDRYDRKGLERIAHRYQWSLGHAIQVRDISLMMFDSLVELHGLGKRERWLLECGALLHDIGWSQPDVPHHKASMELVLNDGDLELNIRERYMVASITRYHRKGLPNTTHYNYRYMKKKDRKLMRKLASIVRIADGLDCSHRSIVKDMDARIDRKKITLLVKVHEGPYCEDSKVKEKKKDLFERTFRRKVVLDWFRD